MVEMMTRIFILALIPAFLRKYGERVQKELLMDYRQLFQMYN